MKIIIIGSGAVGTAICLQLVKESHAITVIDSNFDAVTEISNAADVTGVLGNGADISVLKEANAEEADIVIAVTDSDELNLLCCMIAKKTGNCRVIARVISPEYNTESDYLKNELGLELLGVAESPIKGKDKGNVEYLAWWRKPAAGRG